MLTLILVVTWIEFKGTPKLMYAYINVYIHTYTYMGTSSKGEVTCSVQFNCDNCKIFLLQRINVKIIMMSSILSIIFLNYHSNVLFFFTFLYFAVQINAIHFCLYKFDFIKNYIRKNTSFRKYAFAGRQGGSPIYTYMFTLKAYCSRFLVFSLQSQPAIEPCHCCCRYYYCCCCCCCYY